MPAERDGPQRPEAKKDELASPAILLLLLNSLAKLGVPLTFSPGVWAED